jgi:hypothetical protein
LKKVSIFLAGTKKSSYHCAMNNTNNTEKMNNNNPFINQNDSIIESIFASTTHEARNKTNLFFELLHENKEAKKAVRQYRRWNDSEETNRFDCFEVLGFTKSGRIKVKMTIEGIKTTGESFQIEIKKTIEHRAAFQMILDFSTSYGLYTFTK